MTLAVTMVHYNGHRDEKVPGDCYVDSTRASGQVSTKKKDVVSNEQGNSASL